MTSNPVFFDPSGNRAKWLSRITYAIAILSTLLMTAFIVSLLIFPTVPAVSLALVHRVVLGPAKPATVSVPRLLTPASRLAAETRARQAGIPRALHPKSIKVTPPRLTGPSDVLAAATRRKPLTIGFYVNWDDSSYQSLTRRLNDLDWIVPAWLSLKGDGGELSVDVDPKALDFIRRKRPSLPILPLVQNASNDVWNGASLAALVGRKEGRLRLVNALASTVRTNRFQGVTIDFEEVPQSAQADLLTFVAELSATFRSEGWIVAVATPFDDSDWNYEAYAQAADYLILMAYDQHWSTGAAGSIASQAWFERLLAKRMQHLDPGHTIVALGNYGYDWVKGEEATDLTFQETMLAARDSEAEIEFDDATLTPHFSYVEDDGKEHEVWLLDGVTAFNQIRAAGHYRPAGFALWRLGSEDPSIWDVLGKAYDAAPPTALLRISQGADIDFEGTGEILKIVAEPTIGARTIGTDPDTGLIDEEAYTKLPTSYVMQRIGALPHKVALTFDDGPDPVWTPQILDILSQKKVRASFFVIGENAEANPDLVQRILSEGHDIGNHTFTHPNLGEAPKALVELELNATQRLVEAITGRSMRLFRPPYFGDAEPTTLDEVIPVQIAQDMGYLTVGLRADPDDWQQPAAKLIVERVLAQVGNANADERGQIVLLHDSGGERGQTVKALPQLIDSLRAGGYELVPVSELAGLTPQQAMPPVPRDDLEIYADRPVFLALGWGGHALRWMFLITIGLGFARLFFLCGLALKNAFDVRRRIPPSLPEMQPLLSVLIPAFNEAKVIAASIERVLQSDYRNLEVLVIDDGSSDGTSDVVSSRFGSDDRVVLITIPNSGKATAVNVGLARARGTVVVALDADTQFNPDTISKLVRWFADPRIGAVAGNAKVGNRVNMITRWQALEYITAQNLERRALSALNCITVVPGAVGAWRREALDQLGGFPTDTLAEDQDLTIALQLKGYRVLFDADAIAWTEAPDSFSSLARQRFRWAYGTLQCLWKYRGAVFNPRHGALGMVALPQVWLFQILFAVISPVVDLMLVWQIIGTEIDYLQHREQFNPENLMQTGFYYALFMCVDLLAAVIAFLMEKNEQRSLLWWLILQRFGYRQVMYYVVLKSVVAAIGGPFVGWGKLERSANVSAS